jgi:hypothetical protein
MVYLVIEIDNGRAAWRAWCESHLEALGLIHSEFQPARPWACYHVIEMERESLPA